MPITKDVLIIDDHKFMIDGVSEFLDVHDHLNVVDKVQSANEANAAVVNHGDIDIAVVDLNLPGVSGIDIIDNLSSHGIKCIVLSAHAHDAYVKRAFEAGAQGYVVKGETNIYNVLLKAVDRAIKGSHYFSPLIAQKLSLQNILNSDKDDPEVDKLTQREFEAFRLIGRGMEMGEISEEMNIAKKTVSVYKQRIKEKLNLDTPTDLIQRAMRFNENHQDF